MLIYGEKMLMSAELNVCHVIFYSFWIFLEHLTFEMITCLLLNKVASEILMLFIAQFCGYIQKCLQKLTAFCVGNIIVHFSVKMSKN